MTYKDAIRHSLGKLLVNLLHVVKRTNTALKPEQMASMGFSDRGFESHIHHNNKLFQTLPMSKLEKYSSPRYPQEMKLLGYNRSVRISGRPAIPPFEGGRVL